MSVVSLSGSECHVFARRDILTVSQWASRNLIVQDGIYKGSPLRLDVSPFLAAPMDAFCTPGVQEVAVCGSLQIGKTLLLNACLGWDMDYRPGVKMLAMPTDGSRDKVRDNKLYPLLQGSPTLHRLVAKYRRDSVMLKDGTALLLASAESRSQRASITVQSLFVDEEDLYQSTGESQALEDFKGRTRSYGAWAKILRVCQPKGGDESSIWNGITREVDQLHCYEVRCPSCGEYHLPDMAQVVVLDDCKEARKIRRQKLARYACPSCGEMWSDHARDLAVAAGRWMPYQYGAERGFTPSPAPVEKPISVGYHIPAILSRMVSLSDLAARRLLAQRSDDAEVRRQYANDDLALPFTPVEMQTDSERLLGLRADWLPPRTVPHGAVALTCGIDTQKRGFWFLVRAWMPNLSSYIIDYGQMDTWLDLERLIFATQYPVLASDNASESGQVMTIWRGLIDSGGGNTDGVYTRTEEVYAWVRAYGAGVIFAGKGASHSQVATVRERIIERMPHNRKPIPGGLRLQLVDVGQLKAVDFSRMLNAESRQPLRLHSKCESDLTDQLSAEKLVLRKGKRVWEQVRKDNHLLDCLVLSAACADASWSPSLPHMLLQMERARNWQQDQPQHRQQQPVHSHQPSASSHRPQRRSSRRSRW